MTKNETLKLALEALETSMYPQQKQLQTITAIKEALAQTEPWEKFCDSNCVWTDHHPDCKLAQPEPIKISHKHEWFRTGEMKIGQMRCISCGTWGQEETPQRKPLSEEEIGAILEDVNAYGTRLYTFARAIEAAHGIKGDA